MGGRSSGGCWFRSSTILGGFHGVYEMPRAFITGSSVHQGMRRPKVEEKSVLCSHFAHSPRKLCSYFE